MFFVKLTMIASMIFCCWVVCLITKPNWGYPLALWLGLLVWFDCLPYYVYQWPSVNEWTSFCYQIRKLKSGEHACLEVYTTASHDCLSVYHYQAMIRPRIPLCVNHSVKGSNVLVHQALESLM